MFRTMMDGANELCPYVGLDGRPVERTPEEWPYSYSEYVTYRSEGYRQTDETAWSDRMMDGKLAKFTKCVAAVWPRTPQSQIFSDKTPGKIQKFLSLYLGRPVVLTAVLQGCNQANGFPYWVFRFRDAGKGGQGA